VTSQAGYIVVSVVLAATVIPRRRHPVAAFTVAAVIGTAQIAFGIQVGGPGPVWALQPSNADLAILVLLYTLAAHRPRRVSITGLLICLAGGVVAVTRWGPAHQPNAGTAVLLAAVGVCGLTLTAWVLGDSVAYRYRRTQYAALEERAASFVMLAHDSIALPHQVACPSLRSGGRACAGSLALATYGPAKLTY